MQRMRVCSYEDLLNGFEESVKQLADDDTISDEFKNGFFHALNFAKDYMDQMQPPTYVFDLERVEPANQRPA